MENKRFKVRLNSQEKVEEILQETYDLSCRHIIEIQNEMNKLIASCDLSEATIEEKTKYAKAMHDYVGDKSKAIGMKFEITKFMGELLKYSGDLNKALSDPAVSKSSSLNLGELRKEVNKIVSEPAPDIYKLKGK